MTEAPIPAPPTNEPAPEETSGGWTAYKNNITRLSDWAENRIADLSNISSSIVVIIGLGLSVTAGGIVAEQVHHENTQKIYREHAEPIAVLLGQELEHMLSVSSSISNYFIAEQNVTRESFRGFAEPDLRQFPALMALEWVPRVPAEQLAEYEQAARRDGFADFRVRERNARGELVPVSGRDEYFPVYFVEPRERNEAVLGFDLGSNAARRQALERARDTGESALTNRISLLQGSQRGIGMLAITPVYETPIPPATTAERRATLRGFAISVFTIDELLSAVSTKLEERAHIEMHLYDMSAPLSEQFLGYIFADVADAVEEVDEDYISFAEGDTHIVPIAAADREWRTVSKVVGPFTGHLHPAPWGVGITILLITLTLTFYLRATRNRLARIEQIIDARTNAMRESNKKLEAEIASRREVEQKLNRQNDALQLIHTITAAANSASNLDDAIEICIQYIGAFMEWPVGHAFVLNKAGNNPKFLSSDIWHLDDKERYADIVSLTNVTRYRANDGLIGQAVDSKKSVWVEDINLTPDFRQPKPGDTLSVKTAVAFPVVASGRVLAVIEFFHHEKMTQSRSILDMLEQIASPLARIAEREMAEKAIRARERFLEQITDNLPVLLLYVDRNRNLRFVNELGEKWYCSSREKLIGAPYEEALTPQQYEGIQAYIAGALNGTRQTFSRSVTHRDGTSRHIEAAYMPDLDDNGEVRGFFGIVQDVTRRAEAERQLNQAQKMDAIGELTGGIAHDFNNLLMVINGYTHNAFNDAGEAEKVRKSLDEVLKANERAAQLTKQLLSFSRRQVMEKRVFRVKQALADIEQLLQRSAGERYTLEFADECGNVCVESDQSELGQAIVNLVINARDAMPEGGTIEIATNIVELGEEFTSIRGELQPGRYIEVSVRDQGTGIDEETLQHIFEPFYTTKDQGKGTGLGLAMVYGFANHSGGCVEVESEVGVGTCFKIYLPATDRDPEVMVAEVEGDYRGNGETILLVEDDIALLELVRGMLEALGYNVLAANDGSEALELEIEHEDEGIDLMLSDVVMPVIGGFELANMIRESRPDLHVVFMSGYPNRAAAADQEIPDNCSFLQKPVEPAHLAKAVRTEIDSARESAAAD